MKAPDLKKPRFGSHDVELMSRFDHVTPSGDMPSKVSMRVLLGSFRLSYQIASHVPFARLVSEGKNWSLAAGAPALLMLIYRIADHVRPPSTDCSYEMLAPEVARSRLFW